MRSTEDCAEDFDEDTLFVAVSAPPREDQAEWEIMVNIVNILDTEIDPRGSVQHHTHHPLSLDPPPGNSKIKGSTIFTQVPSFS